MSLKSVLEGFIIFGQISTIGDVFKNYITLFRSAYNISPIAIIIASYFSLSSNNLEYDSYDS